MHPTPWPTQLKQGYKSIDPLLEALNLSRKDCQLPPDLTYHFALKVPESFVKRMQPGNPKDPLLLQILPSPEEQHTLPGFGPDPLQEQQHMPVPGLIHKYYNRALIITTPSCAINCRYCFRQHFPYQQHRLNTAHWQAIQTYLCNNPHIDEVIFSGGDPLLATNASIKTWMSYLKPLTHLRRIRWHTRIPIVLPARIDSELASLMALPHTTGTCVLHCNHPNELNDEVQQALKPLQQANITLLNQAVLLHGVNDRASTQIALANQLFDYGILPYYLHKMDPVQGAHRFVVSDKRMAQIIRAMQARLPGYLVAKLAQDVPNRPAKTILNAALYDEAGATASG
jgi:L-lysine 2,3-aminomutase